MSHSVLLFGLLLFTAGAAQAVSIDTIFIGTTGSGVPGGNTIDADPGDILTVEISITVGPSSLSNYQLSLGWTGSNTIPAQPTNVAPAGWFSLSTGAVGPNSYTSAFHANDLFGISNLPNGAVHQMGTAQITVSESGTVGAFVNFGIGEGIFSGPGNITGEYTFNDGTINVVPEPGVVGLLGLSLVGLAWPRGTKLAARTGADLFVSAHVSSSRDT